MRDLTILGNFIYRTGAAIGFTLLAFSFLVLLIVGFYLIGIATAVVFYFSLLERLIFKRKPLFYEEWEFRVDRLTNSTSFNEFADSLLDAIGVSFIFLGVVISSSIVVLLLITLMYFTPYNTL